MALGVNARQPRGRITAVLLLPAWLYLNINMCAELVTLFTRVSFLLYFSYVILVVNKSFTAVFKMGKRDLYVDVSRMCVGFVFVTQQALRQPS